MAIVGNGGAAADVDVVVGVDDDVVADDDVVVDVDVAADPELDQRIRQAII